MKRIAVVVFVLAVLCMTWLRFADSSHTSSRAMSAMSTSDAIFVERVFHVRKVERRGTHLFLTLNDRGMESTMSIDRDLQRLLYSGTNQLPQVGDTFCWGTKRTSTRMLVNQMSASYASLQKATRVVIPLIGTKGRGTLTMYPEPWMGGKSSIRYIRRCG